MESRVRSKNRGSSTASDVYSDVLVPGKMLFVAVLPLPVQSDPLTTLVVKDCLRPGSDDPQIRFGGSFAISPEL